MRRRRWTIHTWMLVAAGLTLNIISALMTNFFIDDVTRQANELVQQQQNNDKLITLIWQQVETVDRKKEYVLELILTSKYQEKPIPTEIKDQVINEINYWLDQEVKELSIDGIPTLITLLNKAQDDRREKINQLYLDNLQLIEEHADKMKSVSQLRNLALFLQIIGLALVLARDLNWHEHRLEER